MLEPISKVLEEHGDAGEVQKPQKIGGAIIRASEEPSFPLEPGKEAFHKPATLVAVQVASIPVLSLRVNPYGAIGFTPSCLRSSSGGIWPSAIPWSLVILLLSGHCVLGPLITKVYNSGFINNESVNQLNRKHLINFVSVVPGTT